ncbi:MAG TPA: hypothetical protein ENL31_01145, partial [Candidatus Aciduliprofundum boonei]|nr:hypothetical protein [Candidatus Aciduliprofundum boonei]
MDRPQEATSRGAGLIASVALGVYKNFEEIKSSVPIKKVFEPQKNREIYDELY